jgi:hypothetical protein
MNLQRLSWALASTLVLAAWAGPACTPSSHANANASASAPEVQVAAGDTPAATPQPATPQAATPGGFAMKDQIVGEPKTFENLTVLPIFAKTQVDVGALTTLEAALAKGKAEVREVGASGDDGPAVPSQQGRSRHGGGGAQVNTLVIENKGDVAIYVLAGTVVKGGNQDRQIGQDFIIEPKQATPIDAFCVEHGRWTAARDGRATGGKFGATQQLVTSTVRAAAQYKKDQSAVWANVEKVNEAHHKSASSGTLMATLDAPDVQQKRLALVEKVSGFLATAPPNEKLVGFAYAIDGHVKGARWFASHTVFDLFRGQLVSGAAVDALTAQAERGGAPPPAAAPVKPESVVSFVDDVDKAAVTEKRDTAGSNSNEYRESKQGYGSKAFRKPSPAAPTAPKVPISQDYLTK